MHASTTTSHLLIKIGYYLLVGVILAVVLYCAALLFVPLVVSLLLTLVIEPLVKYLETKGLNRLTIVLGICGTILLIGIAFIALVVPVIVTQVKHLIHNMPQYEIMIKDVVASMQVMLSQKFPSIKIPDLYPILQSKVFGYLHFDFSIVVKYASSMFSILSVVVIIPFITFFFLVDGYNIQKMLLSIVPNHYFELTISLLHQIFNALQLFIRGQFIDASAVGIMTAIGLSIIGIPYAIGIGLIAGLGNLVPYLGPVFAFVPTLLAMIVTPGLFTPANLLLVIGVFAVVQFIEGTFVYPIAVGKSVDLHPLVVIIGITIGGQIGGIVGMLICIPIISVFKVAVEVLYRYLKDYSII